jgi:hypothetical protein
MLHLLLGVENADTVTEALSNKFNNLGFKLQEVSASSGPNIFKVLSSDGGVHAAYGAQGGLLVLVYRRRGNDPMAAVTAVHGAGDAGSGFFATADFKEVEGKLGKDGALFFARGSRLVLNAQGEPRLGWLNSLGLPDFVDAFVRVRVTDWLQKVKYGAARLSLNSCAASMSVMLQATDGVELLPGNWLLDDAVGGPDFGRMLPRDTVAMARFSVNVAPFIQFVKQMASLGAGVQKLGNLLGLGGKSVDPIAPILGNFIHPLLADRHLVKDVLAHLTGRFAVGVLGMDADAQFVDLLRFRSNPVGWLHTAELVAALELKDAKAFFAKWWAKRSIAASIGFAIAERRGQNWIGVTLERRCRGKGKGCQRINLVLKGDVLLVLTGRSSLDRVAAVLDGKASDYRGLTREKEAIAVLEHAPMFAGAYFSFDGLLRALRNRNLPGGATRYLAQFYELAMTFDTAGPNARAKLLLTR